jgi:hypothetical protein
LKLALYTTVYPQVKPYLGDWLHSVRRQTDLAFQLWIGLDGLTADAARAAIGSDLDAHFVPAQPGETPAQLRQRIWRRMIPVCDGIVMVDSDDILAATRIESARLRLGRHDLTGCALRLVDSSGLPLNEEFGARSATQAIGLLPRHNVFGLSNTAYRTALLDRCLPLPAGILIADWYLASLAWLLEARLDFDPIARMDYRQHARNMTQAMGPFTADRIVRDTFYARQHFELLSARSGPNHASERWAQVAAAKDDIMRFQEHIVADPAMLQEYATALNSLDLPRAWWICVAHPALADMWRGERT